MLGWEYRRPERVPAAFVFKPAANKTVVSLRSDFTISALMFLKIQIQVYHLVSWFVCKV
jgi:hypothetical protein